MKMLSVNNAVLSLAIGGCVASTALFGAATAQADAMDNLEPLLSSSCSFTQIDAALHVVDPDAAAQLDASPADKAMIEQAYNQPPEQRRAAFEQILSQQKQLDATISENPEFGPKLRLVVDSCHNY
ncbi:hemophore-related protein [Nocardia australiensis]|uniref:hemophore-related protein n=1 Tax=Nocardia australiensis TaxID=2887191 RepID=UPI001D13EBD2|nr:hemophore-related protein [Nocardia australiensis]